MSDNKESASNYYDLIQKEILIKREQLRFLINQPTLLGEYYEGIVREILARFISSKYSIATGIIICGVRRSKQIDIIIFDSLESYPYFFVQNMVIIDPKPVKAIIEVKSEITTNTLKAAVQSLREAIDVYNLSQEFSMQTKPETIIFGYASDLSLTSLEKQIRDEGIDQVVVMSKRNGEIISGQFKTFIENLSHYLEFRSNVLHHKALLVEKGYIKKEEQKK